jgi:hypothetical protein
MHAMTAPERARVHDCLLRGADEAALRGQPVEHRWAWLMAAHVVGQHQAGLHFDTHCRMLDLARETGDVREALGQLVRIALLPFGHLLRSIPSGNIGRSTVRITQRMDPPEPVQVLIDWAVLGMRIRRPRW